MSQKVRQEHLDSPEMDGYHIGNYGDNDTPLRNEMVIKVLDGHKSADTAYVVEQYPHDEKKAECRFWLENDSNGYRLVSQSRDSSGSWGKKKKSPYATFGGAMFLNEEKRVCWSSIDDSSTVKEIHSFLKTFPLFPIPPKLKAQCVVKKTLVKRIADGNNEWQSEGMDHTPIELREETARVELKLWEEIFLIIKSRENANNSSP